MAEKARDFAANLWKRGREVAKQQAQILALQGQIVRLRDQKSRLFVQMGQKVYALFEKELIKNADLLAFCEQVRGIDEEIARKEREIEAARQSGSPEEGTGPHPASSAPPPTSTTGDAPPQEDDPWYAFVRGEEPDAPATDAPPTAESPSDAPDVTTSPDDGQEDTEPSRP